MELFDELIDNTKNWLPKDGTVNYYGKVFPFNKADYYLSTFRERIDSLRSRLQMFVLMAKATLSDASDELVGIG